MKHYKLIIIGVILLIILFFSEKTISDKRINSKYENILSSLESLSTEKEFSFSEELIKLPEEYEKLGLFKFNNSKYIFSKTGNYLLEYGLKTNPWNQERIYYQEDIEKIQYEKYLKEDTDGGGIINKFEIKMKTDPKNPNDDNIDFDGDGFPNLLEKKYKTDFMNFTSHPSLVYLFKIKNFFVSYVPIVLKNILSISKSKVYVQSLSGSDHFLDTGDSLFFKSFYIVLKSYYRDKKDRKKSYMIVNIYDNNKNLIQTTKMFSDSKYFFKRNLRITLENIFNSKNSFVLKSDKKTSISINSMKEDIVLDKIISEDKIRVKSLKDNKFYTINR